MRAWGELPSKIAVLENNSRRKGVHTQKGSNQMGSNARLDYGQVALGKVHVVVVVLLVHYDLQDFVYGVVVVQVVAPRREKVTRNILPGKASYTQNPFPRTANALRTTICYKEVTRRQKRSIALFSS